MQIELTNGPEAAVGVYTTKSPSSPVSLRVAVGEDGVSFPGVCSPKVDPSHEIHGYKLVGGYRANGKARAVYEYVTPTELLVFSDGGLKGANPGPAACAAVALWKRDRVFICEAVEETEQATNNEAEYRGLLLAIRLAKLCGATHVEFCTDSELMARQLAQYAVLARPQSRSTYEVRDPKLVELHNRATELLDDFTAWHIVHVPREQNQRADWLCNQRLRPDSAKGRKPEPPPGS